MSGNAYIAQGASLTAFSNAAFVKQNLDRNAENSNGIETYALYWVLSLLDYWKFTGDNSSLIGYISNVDAKLEHAYSLYPNPQELSFVGWADSLGSGFFNGSTVESQWLYRFLSIRTWAAWADAMESVGQTANATHYRGYADAAIAALRAQPDQPWYAPLGLHSAGEATLTGYLNPTELGYISSNLFNDSTTICSLSNFNQFYSPKSPPFRFACRAAVLRFETPNVMKGY